MAIILHDLGLAVAAYPGGRRQIRTDPGWPDARAAALRYELGRAPSADELAANLPELDLAADRVVLRKQHASRAADLVTVEWEGHHLISDVALRTELGPTAGRIAASHWEAPQSLVELPEIEGAPAGMPQSWTIRPVLLATLLRIADAAHIDPLRAPTFSRAMRQLGPEAERHWDFQARLRQPVLEGDRLRFVSNQQFPIEKAGSWWLCFEYLRRLDDELAAADSMLQAQGQPRLAARSVQGARDPRELARFIRPEGWEPVDARIGVSDLKKVIQRLGGKALYGNTQAVPLRELIQNACDAVRIREAVQPGFEGSIKVHVTGDIREITISDNGVGMAPAVLTGALIDFGRSLWESDELATVLPGLQAVGFQPIGRFGIGFFSVFMWAEEVTVISRPRHLGVNETKVLSFPRGLDDRPILRSATEAEQLHEPGTRVRLHLQGTSPELAALVGGDPRAGSDSDEAQADPLKLLALARWVAPALDVNLHVAVDEAPPVQAITGGDWRTVGASDLLSRSRQDGKPPDLPADVLARVAPIGQHDEPAGRAALLASNTLWLHGEPGALVAGGLRVGGTDFFAGLLSVDDLDASRGRGAPVATPVELMRWATAQSNLAGALTINDARALASAILDLGGDPGSLPLVKSASGLLNRDEIAEWAEGRERIYVLNIEEEIDRLRDLQWIPPDPVVTLSDGVLDIAESYREYARKRLNLTVEPSLSLYEEVVAAIARGWDCDPDEIEVWDAESFDLISVKESEDIEAMAQELVCPRQLGLDVSTE
ncbi:MAG TPA: ATP-binding protein [Solirubrobacterales bacterium]|nr:ATP-binding protein [Solirubrobacterales bacterium]